MNIQRAFPIAVFGIVLPSDALLAEDAMDAPGPGYRRQIEQFSHSTAHLVFTPVDAKQTSDSLQLDRDFSFALKQSASEALPSFEILPSIQPQPKIISPLVAPDELPLWRGARRFEFNGRPFYLIPL